jgi:hypothetical protein
MSSFQQNWRRGKNSIYWEASGVGRGEECVGEGVGAERNVPNDVCTYE